MICELVFVLVILSFVYAQNEIDTSKDPFKALENPRFEKPGVDTTFFFRENVCIQGVDTNSYYFILKDDSIILQRDVDFEEKKCTSETHGKEKLYSCNVSEMDEFHNFTLILHIGGEFEINTYVSSFFITNSFNCDLLNDHFCPKNGSVVNDNINKVQFYVNGSICSGNYCSGKSVVFSNSTTYFVKLSDYCVLPTSIEFNYEKFDSNTKNLCHTETITNSKFHLLNKIYKGSMYMCNGLIINEDYEIDSIVNITVEFKNIEQELGHLEPSYEIDNQASRRTINNIGDIPDYCLPMCEHFKTDGQTTFCLFKDNEYIPTNNKCESIISNIPSRIVSFNYLPPHQYLNAKYTENEYTKVIKTLKYGKESITNIQLKCYGENRKFLDGRYPYRHYICEDDGKSSFEYDSHTETFYSHGLDGSNTQILRYVFDVFYDGKLYYLRNNELDPLNFVAWKYMLTNSSINRYNIFITILLFLIVIFI